MSQAWNRQMQNLNRLVNEYAKQITGPGTGFQLGEAGPLRPTAMSQRFAPAITTGTNLVENLPVKSNLPARIYEVPGYQKGIVYDEISNIKPVIDYTGKQVGYKLPNGTITSNPEIVKYARQAVSKAKMKALPGIIGKGAGILSTAIPFYKDLAFPVANDLYQGFIMGNPDKSKTLQAALNLAGIDRNGNRVTRERIDNTNNTGVPFEVLDDAQLTGGKSVQVNNKSGKVSGQPSAQVARQIVSQLASQPKVSQQEAIQQQANIDAINDYISKLQEINQPYINSLQKYMDNYNDMLDQRQRAARFWQGAASLTGNPAWANIGKQYDTLTNEANKVALIKQIQDAQSGDINAINEVMGNLALAKELNLAPEAAFANKNLLTALTANRRQLTDLEKAQIMADIRRYGYDSAFNRAIQQQQLRNLGNLAVANTYMGGVAPGLNSQGMPQTPYQPLANRQQGGSNLQQAFDMYANK